MDTPATSAALTDLVSDASSGLRSVCELQARYDEVGWRIQDPSWAKARHVMLHLMKITADLAGIVETVEHADERGEPPTSEAFNAVLHEHRRLAADLVFHAAQLANLAEFDIGAELVELYVTNAGRFAPNSEFVALADR